MKSSELGTGMNVRQPVPQSLAWGNLQDAIVEKAADALGLSVLICNHNIFETLFAIPRKIPDPTPLKTESDYEILLESINIMKEPAINIFVCHLKPVKKWKKTKGKENQNDHSSSSDSSSSDSDSDGSGSEQKKKGKRKSKKGKGKKKKKSKLEDEVTENVKCLCEHWQCSVADSSDFWYWSHDEPKHFPLCHDHFRAWAQALLKHDNEIATIKKTLNHKIFNNVPVRACAKGSHFWNVVFKT
ncbi:hypothetical protein L208DRAFT_1378538 [Tricholoma matsutake]|nr:hypothetical protein L208DRAFT_1378538 [Tricholoma matsutake 945]